MAPTNLPCALISGSMLSCTATRVPSARSTMTSSSEMDFPVRSTSASLERGNGSPSTLKKRHCAVNWSWVWPVCGAWPHNSTARRLYCTIRPRVADAGGDRQHFENLVGGAQRLLERQRQHGARFGPSITQPAFLAALPLLHHPSLCVGAAGARSTDQRAFIAPRCDILPDRILISSRLDSIQKIAQRSI